MTASKRQKNQQNCLCLGWTLKRLRCFLCCSWNGSNVDYFKRYYVCMHEYGRGRAHFYLHVMPKNKDFFFVYKRTLLTYKYISKQSFHQSISLLKGWEGRRWCWFIFIFRRESNREKVRVRLYVSVPEAEREKKKECIVVVQRRESCSVKINRLIDWSWWRWWCLVLVGWFL